MSYTDQARNWHDVYENSPDKTTIDKAYTACRKSLEDGGFYSLANDDRAETLVAAITEYLHTSLSMV